MSSRGAPKSTIRRSTKSRPISGSILRSASSFALRAHSERRPRRSTASNATTQSSSSSSTRPQWSSKFDQSAAKRAIRRGRARRASLPPHWNVPAHAFVRPRRTLAVTRQRNHVCRPRPVSWRRAVLRWLMSCRVFAGVSMHWKRGAARKKDALESAHRGDQRIGVSLGFEHTASVAPRSANWWALSYLGKVRSRTSCAYVCKACVASSPISA